MDENGKVIDFALNEKCAAGTGSFLEVMARALEVPLMSLAHCHLRESKQSLSAHNSVPFLRIRKSYH